MMGYIERLDFGSNFVVIEGWVCAADKAPAQAPLTFRICGSQQSGFRLVQRNDLRDAGLGGGLAAFKAVVPLDPPRDGVAIEVIVEDGAGRAVSLTVSGERFHKFNPMGAIDSIEDDNVKGWLFDPQFTKEKDSILLLDGEMICSVDTGVQRPDIDFDLGDRQNLFGFNIPIEQSVKRFAARFPSTLNRRCRLSLSSSGYSLCEFDVLLQSGQIKSVVGPIEPLFRRVARSDILDRLLIRT